MKIYKSTSFEKRIKRRHKLKKEILDQMIRNITDNPSIGEEKKGDLRRIYIYKFKIKTANNSINLTRNKRCLVLA